MSLSWFTRPAEGSSGGAASVAATMGAIDSACKGTGFSCKTVSWDDAERGTVGGALSCWGGNITDTRLWAKDGRQLFTVRSDNWNEKLGRVSADQVAVITGNQEAAAGELRAITLREFLKNAGRHGGYAGVPADTSLFDADLDREISIRFQTTFLPVDAGDRATLEFCTEAYNYNTRSDEHPRNAILLCTTQGLALQQDGVGAKRLLHHSVDAAGTIHRHWLEAERAKEFKVGGEQKETAEQVADAVARGKATAAVLGIPAMGTRFNALMTIQIPVEQPPAPRPMMMCYSAPGCSDGAGGSFGGLKKAKMCSAQMESSSSSSMDADLLCLEEKSDALCASSATFCSSATRRRAAAPAPAPKKGVSNAARVSKGSEVDTWRGLTVKNPRRAKQHVTVTVIFYYTVAGGVPSVEDVQMAIADLNSLYDQCKWTGDLASEGADFMKKELTVKTMQDITAKVTTQPYKAPGPVANGSVFPMDSDGPM